mgnify:FL=1
MKIIKRGVLPQEKEYEVTCTRCTTIFSFLQKEAEVMHQDRAGAYLKILCPVCKHSCTTSI